MEGNSSGTENLQFVLNTREVEDTDESTYAQRRHWSWWGNLGNSLAEETGEEGVCSHYSKGTNLHSWSSGQIRKGTRKKRCVEDSEILKFSVISFCS